MNSPPLLQIYHSSVCVVGKNQLSISSLWCMISPQATHPELYLLPSYMDTSGSTRSHSHSSEMQSYSSNPHTSFRSEPLSTAAGSKEPVRFPEIKQVSNQPPTTSRDGGGGGDDDSSLTSTEEKEEDAHSSYNSGWGEDHSQNENTHEQFQTKKGQGTSSTIDIYEGIGINPYAGFILCLKLLSIRVNQTHEKINLKRIN